MYSYAIWKTKHCHVYLLWTVLLANFRHPSNKRKKGEKKLCVVFIQTFIICQKIWISLFWYLKCICTKSSMYFCLKINQLLCFSTVRLIYWLIILPLMRRQLLRYSDFLRLSGFNFALEYILRMLWLQMFHVFPQLL